MTGRCIIIGAGPVEQGDLAAAALTGQDFIIAADAGYLTCKRLGIAPNLIMGDFDSAPMPQAEVPVLTHPAEKDDTDSMLAVKHGLGLGYSEFVLLGGLGGRLDHTLANIQTLHYIARAGGRGTLYGGDTTLTTVREGSLTLRRSPHIVSVFALDGPCYGVTERGLYYLLEEATVTGSFPIGVSNLFAEETATISVREGTLLVALIRDEEQGRAAIGGR